VSATTTRRRCSTTHSSDKRKVGAASIAHHLAIDPVDDTAKIEADVDEGWVAIDVVHVVAIGEVPYHRVAVTVVAG